MPVIALATQVLLPVALLAWLALFPARGILAYGLQLLSVTAILLGIGLAALWTMPPYWVPYVYGLFLALIIVRHLAAGRVTPSALWSAGRVNTVMIVAAVGLGLAGSYLSALALKGRSLPDSEIVDIAPPFGPGRYLVAHGGSTEMVNIHLRTLDPSIERFRPWRGQSRALDIFKITPAGLHVDGLWPADPARYETFGAPVLAPCSGTVAYVVDGLPDMRVPEMDRENMAGNYAAIDCGGFYVILAHLRKSSIRVARGDRVKTGAPVAEMGNSGNSSEPHLHVHAQRGLPDEAPLGGEPLGLTINGRFPVRNDRIRVSAP